MQFRSFGKLNWASSVLGFGCMRLPVENGNMGAIDVPTATHMLHEGIETGINYIDTAYSYHGGESELFVGRVVRGGYREKVHLATKLPTWLIQKLEDLDHYLDDQLVRLQTDHIDHYLLHALHRLRWEHLRDLGVREWIPKALASGRIRSIGFSFHDNYPVFEQILNEFDGWDFCQIQYNYMDIIEQAGIKGLQLAAGRGLAVVVMEPLLGGKLASPPLEVHKILDESLSKRSPADWALQWLWDQPEVTVVLSGMSTPDQVRQNLLSAHHSGVGTLSPHDKQLIARAREKFKEMCPIPCTRCGYCMPCPNGVDIPRNFEIFNKGMMLSDWGSARFRYGQIPLEEQAEICLDCGDCERVCPQQIAISDWMPFIHDVLGNQAVYDGRRGANPF